MMLTIPTVKERVCIDIVVIVVVASVVAKSPRVSDPHLFLGYSLLRSRLATKPTAVASRRTLIQDTNMARPGGWADQSRQLRHACAILCQGARASCVEEWYLPISVLQRARIGAFERAYD